MDYKEKYEKALEVAQKFYNNSAAMTKKGLEDIFPELKESEDEIVIAALKSGINGLLKKEYRLKGIGGISFDRIIAWLEKQGKQKSIKDVCDTCDEKASCVNSCPVKLVEQKPAWSEEDERIIELLERAAIAAIYHCDGLTCGESRYVRNWLKSIKDRVQPQPKQEWSEEDEQYLLVCKNALAKYQTTDKWDASIISHWLENKLKSLRPQNRWKPSDEQILALNIAIEMEDGDILKSLYQDLLKLKEE